MHDVFISFATPDQPKAEQVRQVLEKNGISCWFAPESMRGSQDFAREIPKAIKSSKAMVLIWSESAQKSQWVEKEVDYAIAKGCPIFPFTLETFDFDEKFDFLISHSQRYAAYLQEEKALGKLVRDLRAVMERDDAEVVIDKESAKPKKKPWLWAAAAERTWAWSLAITASVWGVTIPLTAGCLRKRETVPGISKMWNRTTIWSGTRTRITGPPMVN